MHEGLLAFMLLLTLQPQLLVIDAHVLVRPYPHYVDIVVTQPIAGGPEAGGFARVSPKPCCAKG
jgi:hypothetical protein